jgi:hypothetical protein
MGTVTFRKVDVDGIKHAMGLVDSDARILCETGPRDHIPEKTRPN